MKSNDAEYRLQAIIDTATDGIVTIDERGSIESINPAGASLFGYTQTELIGLNVNVLMPSPYHKEHDSYLQNYRQTGVKKIIGIGREVRGKRKDGTTFPLRLSVAEVLLDERRIFTGILHDISDKVFAVEAQKALEKEKELSELKSRFVSMASHEFRTPLTAILSSATLITKYKDEKSQPKREKHVRRIQSSVRNLTGILNDFLSLSKLEEGRVLHDAYSFNLVVFIEEILGEMESMLKTLQKIIYNHRGNRENIHLDGKLLKNILLNLLSNAIKYSAEGQIIQLTTQVTDTNLILSVRDYGIGIPQKDQIHLFERFFRAENVANVQGTGLGLNIVQRYLQLMGGTITFESALDEGTIFTVHIPLQ